MTIRTYHECTLSAAMSQHKQTHPKIIPIVREGEHESQPQAGSTHQQVVEPDQRRRVNEHGVEVAVKILERSDVATRLIKERPHAHDAEIVCRGSAKHVVRL